MFGFLISNKLDSFSFGFSEKSKAEQLENTKFSSFIFENAKTSIVSKEFIKVSFLRY